MMDYDSSYDCVEPSAMMASFFHDISGTKLQDNWARAWCRLDTSKMICHDFEIQFFHGGPRNFRLPCIGCIA